MKFLVPNYSCLQNPWLRGYRPQIPVISVLNWICWTPPPEKSSWVRHWRRDTAFITVTSFITFIVKLYIFIISPYEINRQPITWCFIYLRYNNEHQMGTFPLCSCFNCPVSTSWYFCLHCFQEWLGNFFLAVFLLRMRIVIAKLITVRLSSALVPCLRYNLDRPTSFGILL